jgi:hypothetical protein
MRVPLALWGALLSGDVPMNSGVFTLLLEDGNSIKLEPNGVAGGLLLMEA